MTNYTTQTQAAWHTLDVSDVAERLDANEHGLSQSEAAARLTKYGPNHLPQNPPTTLWLIVLRQFRSPLIYILALGGWMFWTAIGAASGRRRSVPSAGRVRAWLVVLACALPAAVVFVRGLRVLFGGVPGAYLPFPRQLLSMAMALLPVRWFIRSRV